MSNKISRRNFLKSFAVTTAAFGVACQRLVGEISANGLAQALEDRVFLPFLSSESNPDPTATPTPTAQPPQPPQPTQPPNPFGPNVVHVYSEDATNWDGSDPQYWNYVSQNVVDNMIDLGAMALTGASSVDNAWRAILPNYQPGQGIAIKVSFNNTRSCSDTDGQIDAIIEPVNAVVRGLKTIGVLEPDIWIYDASRSLPSRFQDGCLYNSVQFFGGCGSPADFLSNDANAFVYFNPPAEALNQVPIKISDVLVNASYMINMPIMKHHGGAGVSLAFKNHFGSINSPSDLHDFIGRNGSPDYDAIVDLYLNPHIKDKSILTIGDGIFAAKMNYDPPTLWSTFGNQVPKSLFFGRDPVAIDCVMCDLLDAEKAVDDSYIHYLHLASAAGLGVFERGDPWGSGYNNIDYQKIII